MNYEKTYNDIINRAKNRELLSYKEKHHIIPVCLGGNNDKDNLVYLTAKEHFICHKLLCLIYPDNNKLKYAYWMMCSAKNEFQDRNYIVSATEYARLKEEMALIRSEQFKGKKRNFKHSPESIEKIKAARAKQTFSDETRKKFSQRSLGKTPRLGMKNSEEHKIKSVTKLIENKGIKSTINGIDFLCLADAARYFGIPQSTIRYRLLNNISFTKKIIVINGEEFESITKASKKLNSPQSTIGYRLKNNFPGYNIIEK
jgi:hypothetical protein